MQNFDKIQDRTFVLIFILFYVDIFYHKGEPILPHRHPRSLFDVLNGTPSQAASSPLRQPWLVT